MHGEAFRPIKIRRVPELVPGPGGRCYSAWICGRANQGGRWEGWIEFVPEGADTVLRSPRETTQPDFDNIARWASRISRVYAEGSLHRALEQETPAPEPSERSAGPEPQPAAYPGPAPSRTSRASPTPDDAPVNPFLLYSHGEQRLRTTLERLPASELRVIARAYALAGRGGVNVDLLSAEALVELVVDGVARRVRSG